MIYCVALFNRMIKSASEKFDDEFNQIFSVAETNDKGIIVGGIFYNTLTVGDYEMNYGGTPKAMIIKYNEYGEVQWATSFGTKRKL